MKHGKIHTQSCLSMVTLICGFFSYGRGTRLDALRLDHAPYVKAVSHTQESKLMPKQRVCGASPCFSEFVDAGSNKS